jgi:hypothetical protein
MLTFLMHVRTAWDDYFTGSTTLIQSKEYGTTQSLSDTNVYVSNCLFKSIMSSSSGGALSCSSSVTCLLVESTSFFSCKTSSGSGAIYFSNTGSGQCVLHEICVYDCCTTNTNSYQFAYIRVCNSISNKNYINYSSISRCVNENAWYTFRIRYGKICFPSVNLSMNKCYGRFYCQPLSDSNSVTCSLSYSSITDNIATSYTCLFLYTGGAKYEIKSCNILRNTQGSLDTEGTISTWGNLMIEDSCILENRANNIFYQGSTYTITISNCTVDSTSNNGYLTIQKTVTKSFIHALNHMSTQSCSSEYDSAGYLTPNIQSPSSSIKPKICYTCKRFLLQLQLRDIISLVTVLILNFINPYVCLYLQIFLFLFLTLMR